ncbi:MAG: GntR family transcriptional regulator [Anaerofustis sp.]
MAEHSYQKIVELIRAKIDSGEYRPNDNIPSEKMLCEMTGIGRSTVRKGLSVLVNDGLLYAVQGKGYYVCEPKKGEFLLYFNETSAIETSAESVKVIGVDIISPDAEMTAILDLPPNRQTVLIKRLISDRDTRIAYDCKYIPYSAKSPIIEQELYKSDFPQMFAKEKSLFDIKKKMRITVGELDGQTAKVLRADEHTPAIIIEQFLYDENAQPIGYGITTFLGKYFKLSAICE